MAVEFKDYSITVIGKMNDKAVAFLEEAKSALASQASRNSPVKSGDLKRSFQTDSLVDESELTAYIGSSVEYAIWQEMGTGEYAVEGNGRKGGWCYKDAEMGETVFTRGTRPKRMLYHAFLQKRDAVKARGKKIFGEI